ncbi:MAG TPA: DoxX family protein [Candidatus Dormibacteraeota bacterium]|nr:DoxX family protein [Candidatus Dormibacteraeota bacterium]
MFALGLLILRLVVGLTLAAHGAQKLFGWFGGSGIAGWTTAMTRMRIRPAAAWAWISALAELLGGLGLAIGFLNPLPSLAIAASMLVAIALIHGPKGFFNTKGGYEFNLTLIAAVAALALTGPGAISLDAVLGIRFPEPVTLIVLTILTLLGVGAALFTRTPVSAQETRPQTT